MFFWLLVTSMIVGVGLVVEARLVGEPTLARFGWALVILVAVVFLLAWWRG